ncbi:MAG: transporter substrate-binding domain-containing protein [Roseburia sp.]|nr:transporter substrate-binding domain-containing protein [Roseburia sp.]MCM1243245.1 transporter substrate-binding domain-containing protein [Roseburia sp.]
MKKFIVALLTVVIALGSLTACGSSSDSADSSKEIRTVKVAIGNAWAPFCYLNEDGEEDGYEYQVLKAVDELLEDYEFEFEPLDWTNVLVSLDSGKVDIAAHTLTMNEEREEKYGHSDETYYNYQVFLYVATDNDSVSSLQDLAGQPVFAVTGEASTQAVEAYNEAYPDQAVDLQYASYSTEAIVAAISDGTLSAWFGTTNVLDQINEAYGNRLKTVGDPILDENSVFLMKKEDTELKEAIDGAIKQLREKGTLSELSIQYLGDDFSGAQ